MKQLTKENIKSLIMSVFAMQAADAKMNLGETYKFEMKFTIRDDHLELEGGTIAQILKEGANGELDTRSNT